MKEIKVSVILPVYNVSEFLPQCLDSVTKQTLHEIEIICVNDGSTDHSLSILEDYARKDERFVILTQKNQGAGAARNTGLEVAQGKYISLVDPDDFIELTMLEKLYKRAEATEAELVVMNTREYHNRLKIFRDCAYGNALPFMPKEEVVTYRDVDLAFYPFCIWAPWNKFYLRSFLQREQHKFQNIYRKDGLYFSHLSFFLAKKVSILNEVLYNYRVGMKHNSTSTDFAYPLDVYTALSATIAKLKELEVSKEVMLRYQRMSMNLLLHALETYSNFDSFDKLYQKVVCDGEKDFEFVSVLHNLSLEMQGKYQKIRTLSSSEYLFDLYRSQKKITEKQEEWLTFTVNCQNATPLCFFGAGEHGKTMLKIFKEKGLNPPVAICDNGKKMQGTTLEGIPVIALDEALERYPDAHILISNLKYQDEIFVQVLNKVPQERVFLLNHY